ncbi:PadR family transcriptional regulator, partial [Candidatus Heimdallarchaeota archaeon]
MQPLLPPTKVLDSLLLMQIVHEGSSHGYAIGVAIEDRFGWKPSHTAIYNSLKSLEEEGLVTSKEKIENGRVQKIYSATKEGKDSFEE